MATEKVTNINAKPKRSLDLKLRPATVTNLNFSPEKAGEELVERVDLSLTFRVLDMDVDEIVNTKSNPLKLLWANDGTLQFRELDMITLDFEAEGTLEIGLTDETVLVFENAKIRKFKVFPHIDRQAEIKCQVRIDPTGALEELGQIRIHQDCVLSFSGYGVQKGKNKDQAELEV